MNEYFKQKVITALRGGEYKQGFGVMRNEDNCFCVMGVVADVAEPDMWKQTGCDFWSHDGALITISSRVGQLYGIDSYGTLPIATRDSDCTTLMSLNDDGLTFSQLADLVEAFL